MKHYVEFLNEKIQNKYESVADALKAKNYGIFINDNNEYCTVYRYYDNNKLHFKVYFKKGFNDNQNAKREAIITTSEKKVLKILNSENFILTDENN